MTVKTTNFRSADYFAGYSLLEVLIAMGLVGVIMMALLSMMDIMNANNKRLNLILVRNDVVNNIRTQSLLYSNIDNSALMTNAQGAGGIVPNVGAPNNLAHFDTLAKCLPSILDPTLAGCSKATVDEVGRGNLFYLADHNSLDINRAIAGEDVFYRTSGSRCDPSDASTPEKCPLFARVWAEPFCLNFANYCNKAMALTIRYSVGVRADYPGGSFLPTADGEVYLPLQKGIQISRLLDQNNTGLTANQNGIYPVQKFLGMPDQTNSPQGLRFEVIIGNPTGLEKMTVQSRSLVGQAARGLDENSIPPELEKQKWDYVPTPGGGSGHWTIALKGAQPGQIFNFGTMTTSSAVESPTKVSFEIGSLATALNASTYHWTKNPSDPTLLAPPTFKSGFYQFRIEAEDSLGGRIVSTNYITVRITPRPEVFLIDFDATSPTKTVERDCTPGHDLPIKVLVGDDEEIRSVSAVVGATPVSLSPPSGTQGQVTIPFALDQPVGDYKFVITAKDFFSNKLLLGSPIPETKVEAQISTKDVTPFLSPITSNPKKIRIENTGDLTVSYITGTCCKQTPKVVWDYNPNKVGTTEIMLTGPVDESTSVCSSDIATNRRICQGQVTVTGKKEGPISSPTHNVSSTFKFDSDPPTQSCAIKSPSPTAYTIGEYVPVISIPGITFYTSESLWVDFSDLSNEAKLLKPIRRLAWVQADFDPEENISVKVAKITDHANPICTVSFSGGTSMMPVLKSCLLPSDYSGDYVLLKGSPNVKGEADAEDPMFRAKLISGKTVHRVCNTKISFLAGFSATLDVPLSKPMWNSPFNAVESPPDSGNTSGGQDAKNDAGNWAAGSLKRLRCYDNWSKYSDSLNDQDIKVITAYKASLKVPDTVHNNFTFNYLPFVFPNNSSPNFASVDFDSPNTPTFFLVLPRGAPGSAKWTYAGGVSESATTPAQPWVDRTSELCTGAADLSQVRIFSSPMIGFVNGTTAMKASSSMSSSSREAFSYAFVCTYGRWNPNAKSSTTWIH